MRQLLCLLLLATACSSSKKTNNPDAPITPTVDGPASASCKSPIALGAQDIADNEATAMSPSIAWTAPVTTDLGDGGTANISFEFYSTTAAPDLTKATDLSMGDQNNYGTCAACVRLETLDSSGNPVREYFQSGGTLQLTADPLTSQTMIGTIKDLVVDEVTIDSSTATSTPVANGKCVAVGDVTLNHDKVPNAYTCAKPTYADGATCNCACGAEDSDCNDGKLPVAGCTTATPLCSDDGLSCVPRPTCTVNAALATPTLTTPTATFDSMAMETEYTANLNADTLPDQLDIQLWDGTPGSVFANGVAPGTYQLTGVELDYNTCGACVQLFGDVDATNGPTQTYMATAGTLTLTSTTTTITGTLSNATFGAIKFDGDMQQVPDGSNCASAITTVNFTSPITTMFQGKTTQKVRVHINHGKKPAHPTRR